MNEDDKKHVAGFAGLMVAGMGCMYLFAWMMSLAAALDK